MSAVSNSEYTKLTNIKFFSFSIEQNNYELEPYVNYPSVKKMYSSLHQIKITNNNTPEKITYTATISHRELSHIKGIKPNFYQKKLSSESIEELWQEVNETLEKWDRKYFGAFPGPTCDYDATKPKCPTGFTWIELEEHRKEMIRNSLRLKGISDEPTDETFCTRPIPTYKIFFDISLPKKNKEEQ